MPWYVAKSKSCPSDRPWGIFKKATGEKVGCSESKEMALKSIAARYRAEGIKKNG